MSKSAHHEPYCSQAAATNHSGFALANGGGAAMGIGNADAGNISQALIECAKQISPRKTWGYLVNLIRVSERVAKHRLAGTREFTVDELAMLLRSERGIDYLVAIMGDAEPAWWRRIKKHIAVAEAAQMQRVARRQLQEAINADADLSAAIARAAILQDPEFYQPHVDALGAIGRLPHQPVAAATKRVK